MELKLHGAVIRSWMMADAEAMARYANNRKIAVNLRDAFPQPYSIEDAKRFLEFLAREQPEVTFAIATTTEAIGCIGLRLGTDVHRKTAELGYWLGEPFWGRGLMTEAVAALSRWALENLELNRIYAEPFANNPASARVLEKRGSRARGD